MSCKIHNAQKHRAALTTMTLSDEPVYAELDTATSHCECTGRLVSREAPPPTAGDPEDKDATRSRADQEGQYEIEWTRLSHTGPGATILNTDIDKGVLEFRGISYDDQVTAAGGLRPELMGSQL